MSKSAVSVGVSGPVGLAELAEMEKRLKESMRSKDPKELRLREVEARAMLRILCSQFGISPRVIFSSRMKNLQGACYQRPVLLLLPEESTGLLTEGRVIHEVAHVLDLEQHRLKPHSKSFMASEAKAEEAWYGVPVAVPGGGGQSQR